MTGARHTLGATAPTPFKTTLLQPEGTFRPVLAGQRLLALTACFAAPLEAPNNTVEQSSYTSLLFVPGSNRIPAHGHGDGRPPISVPIPTLVE